MKFLYGLIALLACTASALASTTLTYTGADLAKGNGTLTITCTDSTIGLLWTVGLTRQTAGPQVQITSFKKLSGYNYAFNHNDPGLFTCHYTPGASGKNICTGTFAQIHKDSDSYSFSMTIVKQLGGVNQWRQVATYTLAPATSAGTRFTCQVQTTNTSGSNQTSPAWMAGLFQGRCHLNAEPPWLGGSFSGYQKGSDGYYMNQLEPDRKTPALWQVTDNLNAANPGIQFGQPAWGQATVLSNSRATGAGLVAGVTFRFSSDLENNSASGSDLCTVFMLANNPFIAFRIAPSDWGCPTTWTAGATYTHYFYLDINITNSGVPSVADSEHP